MQSYAPHQPNRKLLSTCKTRASEPLIYAIHENLQPHAFKGIALQFRNHQL